MVKVAEHIQGTDCVIECSLKPGVLQQVGDDAPLVGHDLAEVGEHVVNGSPRSATPCSTSPTTC
jgi:hypothetical protein